MTNYKQLAVIYLKHNKKRTLVTITGVMLCVIVLFLILNLTVSYIITGREEERKNSRYEVFFYCDDMETANALTQEACVKDGIITPQADIAAPTDENAPESWETWQRKVPALYTVSVNFQNPYRMIHYAKLLSEKYHADYRSSYLDTYYLQSVERDMVYTLLLTILLIAFIFAVLGVGLVRNSIQLISLEQIRDYGILRCIGSTKRQLKSFIYVLGMILELAGIFAGLLLGFPIYALVAKKLNWQIGFHVVILPFILLTFLGDLYFVMQENCKFVNSLTPISAVKGEFKIKKEKIKARKSGLAAKLFGFEGDYAVKSLLRNPSRFWKSTASIGLGIGMVIVSFSIYQCINTFFKDTANHYGKYQILEEYTALGVLNDHSRVSRADDARGALANSRYITESKPLYMGALYPVDALELPSHYTQTFATDSYAGQSGKTWEEQYLQKTPEERASDYQPFFRFQAQVRCYDPEDYRSLKKHLTAGTLDISEQGILLVNHTYTRSNQMDLRGDLMLDYAVYDYQIGDQITFLDPSVLDRMLQDRILAYHRKQQQRPRTDAEDEPSSLLLTLQLAQECRNEMIELGLTKTYTIEGILDKDTIFSLPDFALGHFVLPEERFFQETGILPEEPYGKMYHMKGKQFDTPLKQWLHPEQSYADQEGIGSIWYCEYLEAIEYVGTFQKVLLGSTFFVLFIVSINIMNILNTTASNLHLRRKEFAQLRVLGMSKKHLIRTVLLEGVLTAGAANIAGLLLGSGFSALLVYLLNLLYHVEYHFPWLAYLAVAAASVLLLCGSIHGNLRELKMGMAQELTAGGE